MKLLSPAALPDAGAWAVFRQSATTSVVATVAFALASVVIAGAARAGYVPPWIAMVSIAVLLMFAAVSAITLRRARLPENWLLRISERHILVNLRSWLNSSFPDDTTHVLQLDRRDVTHAGITEVTIEGRERSNEAAAERVTFLDLILRESVDTAALADCLRHERALRGRGTTWRHYPVTLADAHTIRLEWRSRHARITPSIQEAAALLGSPPEHGRERVDLQPAVPRAPSATVARDVRQLAQQGRIIEATMLAQRELGCTAAQARQLVDHIMHDHG